MDEPDLHETTKEAEHKHWRFTIAHSFALVILFAVLQLWIYWVIDRVSGLKPEQLRWYHFCVLNGIAGGMTLAVGAYINDFSLHSMLLDHLPQIPSILGGIFAIVGIAILSSELNNILNYYFPLSTDSQIIDTLMQDDLLGVFITVLLVAPIVEEMLFRGIILEGLARHYKLMTAVLTSSILFALVHLPVGVIVALNIFFLALFLAWVRLESGSLLLCVICHATFNAIPFVTTRIWKLDIPGFTTTAANNAVQFQPHWFDALGFVLFVIGVAALKYFNRKNVKTNPSGQGE
jgi:membrane protease YdiL (CAAX protease family)